MFVHELDRMGRFCVMLFSGDDGEGDFERYLEAITKCEAAFEDMRDVAVLLVVDADSPPPDARWRKRIADATGKPHFRGLLHAFVSSSIVIRSVITALTWIRPPPYVNSVHSDVRSAIAWIETRRHVSIGNDLRASLQRLRAQIAKAKQSAGAPARP